MIEDAGKPVCVSRTMGVPAQQVFDVLACPANHPLIDGSGMLRAGSADVVAQIGDVFMMSMHNDEMGDYVIANHVVQFERGKRIAWEPVLAEASRPEDEAEIGDRAGHRWSFDLTEVIGGRTQVTETYDCSRAPQWLRKAVKDGVRWVPSMTATLEKLDALCRDQRLQGGV
jgi:hypothetical protein